MDRFELADAAISLYGEAWQGPLANALAISEEKLRELVTDPSPLTKEQCGHFVRVMSQGIADRALLDFDEGSAAQIPANYVVLVSAGFTELSRESARLIGEGLRLRQIRFKIVNGDNNP